MPKYRVYIEQVNQSFVEVIADSKDKARDKGYRKWRKYEAHSRVSFCEEIKNEPKG